ncbi:hypothetical protein RHMOL_Rhmol04G0315900 [Rhododendron molle]|uniref:Uncharacterized protein n=1 Tax=Rhododendron molle TaxID=49168 RepID=A0ACC0P7Z5_RHOML|nr:hypothetical protein RHMOL_Rhmol04G0315900 [Rhododendron molle]
MGLQRESKCSAITVLDRKCLASKERKRCGAAFSSSKRFSAEAAWQLGGGYGVAAVVCFRNNNKGLFPRFRFEASVRSYGDYDDNQGPDRGMPVLVKKASFKAFVAANTIAVILCSASSVFLYVFASLYNVTNGRRRRYVTRLLSYLNCHHAMVAMMVAFISGTYAIKERKENRKKERAEEMSKMAKTHIIVATLISTISFAAGFTIPGGYDVNQGPNEGMAAIFSSKYEGDKRAHRYMTAFWLIIIAMVAMSLAFTTEAYVVLARSLGLAITTCVIGCSSFIVYAFELDKEAVYAAAINSSTMLCKVSEDKELVFFRVFAD